jgi:hypothetical protein
VSASSTVLTMNVGKESDNVSPSFPCLPWGLETCRCWEGPGIFTLSSEKVNNEGKSTGGDTAQGRLQNPRAHG